MYTDHEIESNLLMLEKYNNITWHHLWDIMASHNLMYLATSTLAIV